MKKKETSVGTNFKKLTTLQFIGATLTCKINLKKTEKLIIQKIFSQKRLTFFLLH